MRSEQYCPTCNTHRRGTRSVAPAFDYNQVPEYLLYSRGPITAPCRRYCITLMSGILSGLNVPLIAHYTSYSGTIYHVIYALYFISNTNTQCILCQCQTVSKTREESSRGTHTFSHPFWIVVNTLPYTKRCQYTAQRFKKTDLLTEMEF